MVDRGKGSILGVGVDMVDYDAAVARVVEAATARRPLAVTALAVHGVMTGALDRHQRHRLNAIDLVVPDGQPVRWALNALYGARLSDRVYGPTFMLRVCEAAAAARLPIFLYGSRLDVLDRLGRALQRRFPDLSIAGARPSAFRRLTADEQQAMIDDIRASHAAIVFVGLGCPRQETWAYECRDRLSMPVLAVGAAFDFHAGSLPQAPPALQKYGLEWLYRLAQEPRRLWRRYLLLNPAYVSLLVLQATGLHTLDAGQPPLEEMRYG